MLLATALALLITGCVSIDVYYSKQPAAVAPKETITHHFFAVSGIGQKKTVDVKICGGAENVVKNRNPANIRKWIARFYYFRHLYPLEARVYCSQYCTSCPSIATLSALLINILLGSSSCFCIVITSSEGEIIPFSAACQSGELHYPRREGGGGFTD